MTTLLLPPDDWTDVAAFFAGVRAWVGKYSNLPLGWRVPFREEKHFASMVDDYISGHIRKVFNFDTIMSTAETLVKDPDTVHTVERVFLDIYTELYLRYAGTFYRVVTSRGFTPISGKAPKDHHVMVLTLSLSSIYFSRGGLTGARAYLYDTIYDNSEVQNKGLCLLTRDVRMLHRVRTSRFVSSPALFVFVSRDDWDPDLVQKRLLASIQAEYGRFKEELDQELLAHISTFMSPYEGSGADGEPFSKILAFPGSEGDTFAKHQ